MGFLSVKDCLFSEKIHIEENPAFYLTSDLSSGQNKDNYAHSLPKFYCERCSYSLGGVLDAPENIPTGRTGTGLVLFSLNYSKTYGELVPLEGSIEAWL